MNKKYALPFIFILLFFLTNLFFFKLDFFERGFFEKGFFEIKKIKIIPESLSCVSSDQIKKDISSSGQNNLFLDDEKIKKELKLRYICIDSVSLNKVLPDEIRIQVFPRVPIFKVSALEFEATSSSSAAQEVFGINKLNPAEFLVDRHGIVFDTSSALTIPSVWFLNQEIFLSKRIETDIIEKLITINNQVPNIKHIKVSSDMVFLNGEQNIILSLKKDLKTQLASLQLILQKAKINSKTIDMIDLRFDKPVVVYSPKND